MKLRHLSAQMGVATLMLLVSGAVLAHHGWSWTEADNVEVTGVIKTARLGNPHGVLTMDVDGEEWTAEVGQPWRNERAGLTDEMLSEGAEVTISGQRSRDAEERRVKAERVIIDDQVYQLYPDRN